MASPDLPVGSNILLTGGTGFFGKALIRHWIDRSEIGYQPPMVTVMSRTPSKLISNHPEFIGLPWLTLATGDILDPASFPANAGFTHLLHAATDSTYGPRLEPLDHYTQVVEGTRHMLEYAVTHKIKRFLLTSSGGVYGRQPDEIRQISENHCTIPDPLNPRNAYSIGKRCAEHLCALYSNKYGIETVIARCFTFVGQDLPMDAHFAVGNFILDAMTAPNILVKSDGGQIRSYMDQRDLAHWLVTLLAAGQAGEAYNVGSDRPILIKDLAQKVRDLLAPQKNIQVLGSPVRHNFRDRYVPSITKATETLELKLRHEIDDSIKAAARGIKRR